MADAAEKVQGTPKSLEEAVGIVLCNARGPRALEDSCATIRDYLAQQFNIAFLETPEADHAIKRLWVRITGGSDVKR